METGNGVSQGHKPKCFAKSEGTKAPGNAGVSKTRGGQVGATEAINGRSSSNLRRARGSKTQNDTKPLRAATKQKTRRGHRAGRHVRDTQQQRRDYALFAVANGVWRVKGQYEAYLDTSNVQTGNPVGQHKPEKVVKEAFVTNASLNPIPRTWVNERRLAALKLQRHERAARIAAESYIVHLECEKLAAKWLMFAAITHVRKDTGRGVPCGGTNINSKTRHVGSKHNSDSGTVVERASLRGHKEWRKWGNKGSNFCSTGGAASKREVQTLRFKSGKKIDVARNRTSNMNGKAHALHFIYDNIDPSQARVTLRRVSERLWRDELLRRDGISSPYKHESDALTQFLVGKPGACKVGHLADWNRWPKNLNHGDKWLEAWLKMNPWATRDQWDREYQTEPYGFSLKIDKGPEGWTEAKMKDWGSNIVSLNPRNLRRAVKLVADRYSIVLGRYMSGTEVRESKEYKKTKGKSLGFFGALGANKLEVAQHPKFRAAVKEFMAMNLPAFHMAFPKPETLKISKITKKGPRMIVGAALEMEFVERMATQQFALSMIENRWELNSKIGIHNNEWNRLYNTVAGGRTLAVDYSFQDLRMPREITAHSISLRTDKLPKTFRYQGQTFDTAMIQRALTHGSAASFVVGPAGDIWKREHGVASGMYNTAPVNTTNHEILNSYMLLQMGMKQSEVVNEVTENQYGDDWLAKLSDKIADGRVTIKKYAKECHDLNMEFTYDAFLERAPREGPIPNNIVFLQRSFERMKDGKVTARFLPNRMMAKFMTCHSDIKSARQSYERALNMLNLTGNAPHEYNIISTYIRHLGYTPPSYEEVMRTHYLECPGDSIESCGRIEVVLSDLYNQMGIEGSKHWQEGQKESRTLVTPDGKRVDVTNSSEILKKKKKNIHTPGLVRGDLFYALKKLGYDGLRRHDSGKPRTIEFEYYEFRGSRFLRALDLPFGWRLAISIGAWFLSGPGFLVRLSIPRQGLPDFMPVHFKATLYQGTWDWSGLLLLGGDVETNPGPDMEARAKQELHPLLRRVADMWKRGVKIDNLEAWARKCEQKTKKKDIDGVHPEERRKVKHAAEKFKWCRWHSSEVGEIVDGDYKNNGIEMDWRDAKALCRGVARKGPKLLLFSPTVVSFVIAFVDGDDPLLGEKFISSIWNTIRIERNKVAREVEAKQKAKAFGVMTSEEKEVLLQDIMNGVGKDPIVDGFLREHFVQQSIPVSDPVKPETDKTENRIVLEDEVEKGELPEGGDVMAAWRENFNECMATLQDTIPDEKTRHIEFRRLSMAVQTIIAFIDKFPSDHIAVPQWEAFVMSRCQFFLRTSTEYISNLCVVCGSEKTRCRCITPYVVDIDMALLPQCTSTSHECHYGHRDPCPLAKVELGKQMWLMERANAVYGTRFGLEADVSTRAHFHGVEKSGVAWVKRQLINNY